MILSRADQRPFIRWLWRIDLVFLFGIFMLMISGFVLCFAASPAVAERLGLDAYYFIKRQALFLALSLGIILAGSTLSLQALKRVSLGIFLVSFILLIITPLVGADIKGAKRWIDLFGVSVQPSEFMKPSFIVLSASLLTQDRLTVNTPRGLFAYSRRIFASVLFLILCYFLFLQPDFGQMMLLMSVWFGLFFIIGISWYLVAGCALLALTALWLAYLYLPHVTQRVEQFMNPTENDTYQIDTAISSFLKGGWFGLGPGEGNLKGILPDAHADFIFAVAGEEFGILVCLFLVFLFSTVVMRVLFRMRCISNPFAQLATCGLIILFGLQAAINMAVTINLIPSKGMTLPFISYGGSSLLSIAFTTGLILALTRRDVRCRCITGNIDS